MSTTCGHLVVIQLATDTSEPRSPIALSRQVDERERFDLNEVHDRVRLDTLARLDGRRLSSEAPRRRSRDIGREPTFDVYDLYILHDGPDSWARLHLSEADRRGPLPADFTAPPTDRRDVTRTGVNLPADRWGCSTSCTRRPSGGWKTFLGRSGRSRPLDTARPTRLAAPETSRDGCSLALVGARLVATPGGCCFATPPDVRAEGAARSIGS
jgi:hypothetical protein